MQRLSYLIFRFFTFPVALLPLRAIHSLGNFLGIALYYVYPKYRKRCLSNLALATDLHLSPDEIVKLAKASLQNLMITALEYPKLYHIRQILTIARCENPETASEILTNKTGLIFFCGHQANWELFFLEGTKRMPGVAIGRPIKNPYLYNWVIRLRQKFGGKIVQPQNALKEGLRAFKNGAFFGIVGDQGMPDSGFSSLFLGRRAWTSPLPAFLALRTGANVIVATNKRVGGKYLIHYSDPIIPQKEDTVESLMHRMLSLLEKSIKERPEEWLWVHNRWKQEVPGRLPKKMRQEAIAIILGTTIDVHDAITFFRTLYPLEFLTFFVPAPCKSEGEEIHIYNTIDDVLVRDYRFKLVYDFTRSRAIKRHFLKLAAFTVICPTDLSDVERMAHNAP